MKMETNICDMSGTFKKYVVSKSASFSGSPLAEKYELKQLFKNKDGDTVVRHYSYKITDRKTTHTQQIHQLYKYTKPSKAKSKPSLHSKNYSNAPYEGGINNDIPDIKFGTPFKHMFNFAKHVPEEQGFENYLEASKDECTPMEIDSSLNKSESKMDTSLDADKSMSDVHHQDNKNDVQHKNKVPKLSLMPKKSKTYKNIKQKNHGSIKSHSLFRMFKILCIFFIPISLGVVCMFCNSDTVFFQSYETKETINNLRTLLYGQDEIINKLEYNLNIIKNNKIFIFTGGVGVGKTYAAQIIERHYPWKNNIQKFIITSQMQYADLETDITNNLVKNAHNLIIIDGMLVEDIYYILPVINSLSVSGTRFLIIIIFNLQDPSINVMPISRIRTKSREISKIFYDNNIIHSSFVFDHLNEDDTKECIKYAINKRGLIINDRDVESVLENINYKYSGCKGVYRKVALLE